MLAKMGFSLQICFMASMPDMHLPVIRYTAYGEPCLNFLQAKAITLNLPSYFLLLMRAETTVMSLPCPFFKTAEHGRCAKCVSQTLMQESVMK